MKVVTRKQRAMDWKRDRMAETKGPVEALSHELGERYRRRRDAETPEEIAVAFGATTEFCDMRCLCCHDLVEIAVEIDEAFYDYEGTTEDGYICPACLKAGLAILEAAEG